METLVNYLLRSVLISGLMLGYYCVALRNRRSHSFNRIWLLMTLLASVVLPLLRVGWLTWHIGSVHPVVITGAGAHPAARTAIPLSAAAVVLGGAVGIVLLAVLIVRIARIYSIKRRNPRHLLEGCCLIEVRDRRAPFSFLSNLFWQEGMDIGEPIQRRIFDHELAHIRGGHTYDSLFAQLLTAVCWMNPFFWLIRRELQMVHEFIADEASVGTGGTETFARMLLRAYDGGRYLDPSQHFFHSPIKRRLRMISSSKPPSGLRKALALPVLLAVTVLACSKEQSADMTKVKPLPPNQALQLKLLKLKTDSVTVRALNQDGKFKVFKIGLTKEAIRQFKFNLDTLVQKRALEEVSIVGKESPPPPPQPSQNH